MVPMDDESLNRLLRAEHKKFEDILSSAKVEDGTPGFYGPEDKWQMKEEFILLNSVQFFNHGNWSQFAEILSEKCKKDFTAEEVEEHYINTYMKGEIAEALAAKFAAMKAAQGVTISGSTFIDCVSPEDDELLNSVDDVDRYKNIPPEFLDQIGFDPTTGEFKEEYAPEAEGILHGLNVWSEEPYDRHINLLSLDAYRQKVKERYKLKKAIKKFNLIEMYYEEYQKKSNYRLPDILNSENSNTHEVDDSVSSFTDGNSKTLEEKEDDDVEEDDDDEEEVEEAEDEESLLQNDMDTQEIQVQEDSKQEFSEDYSDQGTIQNGMEDDLFPELEQLTEEEKRLCKDLDIETDYYVKCKTFLVHLDYERRAGRAGIYIGQLMIPPELTVAEWLRIINFLIKTEWIDIKTKDLMDICE